MKPIRIGEVAVETVVESPRMPMQYKVMLPSADPAAIESARGWLEPRFADLASGELFLAFHTYLLRTPQHTVLIDTCVGNDKQRPRLAAFHQLKTNWLAQLRAAGVTPESVDFVMCTHMHGDHIGWNTRLENGRWVPTFPNARYIFARTEFERSRSVYESGAGIDDFRATGYVDSVLPVVETGQSMIVESDHVLDDHLSLEPAPGHSPGNVLIHLRSKSERAVFSGDVLHHPIQVMYPEWSTAFCEDPLQSAATRQAFVARYADSPTLVLTAHFSDPTAGHIARNGARCKFRFCGD